jgi:hypothetical protein
MDTVPDETPAVKEPEYEQPNYFVEEAVPIYDQMEEELNNAPIIVQQQVDQHAPPYTYQVIPGFDDTMYNNQQQTQPQFRQYNGRMVPDNDPFRNRATGFRHCALKYGRHHPPSLRQLGHLANYMGLQFTTSLQTTWRHFHEPVTYLAKNINGNPTMRILAGYQETQQTIQRLRLPALRVVPRRRWSASLPGNRRRH